VRWQIAVDIAKQCFDLTFEEWCDLYVNRKHPTREQIARASKVAHTVLVRNGEIEESVRFV
jgi:frataxin-like iron-binding protein CyaY